MNWRNLAIALVIVAGPVYLFSQSSCVTGMIPEAFVKQCQAECRQFGVNHMRYSPGDFWCQCQYSSSTKWTTETKNESN